ncbi:MAG: RNA polymerase sigma factor [Actinomycetota bacterium]
MQASENHVESLYRERFRSLVGFARRSLPSYADAEDVVQTSFLKVLEKVDLASLKAPSSYVRSVVKNEVVAELRSRSTGRRKLEKVASQPLNDGSEDPSESLQEGELRRVAVQAAEALPARQRRVLLMYLDGMTPLQIAETESTSLRKVNANQISCLISRTSKSLQRTMAREGLLSAAPIASLRVRFRQLCSRLEPAMRWIETSGVVVVCAVAVAQLSLLPGARFGAENAKRDSAASVSSETRRVEASVKHGPPSKSSSGSGGYRPGQREKTASMDVPEARHSVELWREREERHPGLVEQIFDIVEDPGNVPPPECGGLPVCP